MSRPRFLADEDLTHHIVRATLSLEPSIEFATVVELGLGSAADEEVLEYAAANDWLVVSHDVNTMKAAAETRLAEGLTLAGLFMVPQSRPVATVAESLVLIWSGSEAEEWQGRIVYLPL